jgi:hypothetical protein
VVSWLCFCTLFLEQQQQRVVPLCDGRPSAAPFPSFRPLCSGSVRFGVASTGEHVAILSELATVATNATVVSGARAATHLSELETVFLLIAFFKVIEISSPQTDRFRC